MRDASSILADWYAGEVGGEALFSTLSRTSVPAEATKWDALALLERATAARLAAALTVRGCPVPAVDDPARRAEQRCAGIANTSWLGKMQWLHEIADAALQRMQVDADLLPADCAVVGALVLEHERALLEFAAAELAGRGERALLCVEAVLGAAI